VPKKVSHEKLSKYKLHYIYREFTIDFFKVDLDSLPHNASSLQFRKQSAHIMGLCLTYHVNLKLSLRETRQAMKEIHDVSISHTMISNYAKTAAAMIKPFTDRIDMEPSNSLTADETYVTVKGVQGYVWFIADAVKRTILGYTLSDNRSVGPCIIAMRDAFRKFKIFPSDLTFVADGYSVYPLAAQQFAIQNSDQSFEVTQVIGLTNDDEVSTKFRPLKQIIERLNRTFKRSYKLTNGFHNFQDAYYGLALWVIYYNFLRPHRHRNYQTLIDIPELQQASTMPAKWQLLIYYGQKTILEIQEGKT
jgi:transposase-like protein